MAFRVEIQPQAFDDLDSIADYIRTRSSFATAEKGFNGIMEEIAALKEMPKRCPIASESEDLGQEVRVLLHGRRNRTYKVCFSIDHHAPDIGVVSVFHVRHWARKPVAAGKLQDLMDESPN